MHCTTYGRYSDDPLDDSLLSDDELRMQEELDEEIRQYELEHGEDKRGSTAAVVSVLFVMALFIWWFFWG